MGRQTLSYDDERILGGLDWNVAGRYHDALKLGYESKVHRLHLILAFNQNDEKVLGGTYYKAGGQPYKNMQSAWYRYQAEQNRFGQTLEMLKAYPLEERICFEELCHFELSDLYMNVNDKRAVAEIKKMAELHNEGIQMNLTFQRLLQRNIWKVKVKGLACVPLEQVGSGFHHEV